MIKIPRQVIFTIYITSTPYNPLITPIYTINFNNQIKIPQNYKLNTKQIIKFNFNNINTSLFNTTKPKNQPTNIIPQTKNITIKYTNITTQTYLTIHLKTNTISNQTIISNNQNLNFIITNQNNTPITPNNLNNIIPFHLNTTTTTNITLHT